MDFKVRANSRKFGHVAGRTCCKTMARWREESPIEPNFSRGTFRSVFPAATLRKKIPGNSPILKDQGVSEIYIEVIKSIYKNNTGRIKLETLGTSFRIGRGVRQGDPLSPKIFKAILENIISKLDWRKLGLYIQGAFLSHLTFADDIVILSEKSSQLQYIIESLQLASAEV
ncbi:hypothetical protein K1T71_005536 [Dendrolimus kikuchii]|uniref:Uncharacterized protein n=1 Tax=Dendrolimus kikuchii TaxID=765133 RepID=A0ACC1D4L4_9NEOP|nr:hypothetical protein K1T71_005536 [Dendrolimus kikuchii]